MKYLKVLLFLVCTVLLINHFVPFLKQDAPTASETVVCSFSILKDLSKQLCENTPIDVITIVPNSIDPHTYQPRPSDSKILASAGLVVINGLNLEGWVDGIIAASNYKGRIVTASSGVDARYLGRLPDPHIWHDPELVCQMIENIKNELVSSFPNYQSVIEKNACELKDDLRKLKAKIGEMFKNVPKEKRVMLTTHDAFSYFAKCYDVIVLSPQGVSTSDDPSAADVKDLINQIRSLDISAIFFENLANRKIIDAIALETKKDVKGVLFADTLKDGCNLQETLLYNAQIIVEMMQ